MYDVLDLREMLAAEIVQRRESGHLVDGLAPSAEAIAAADDGQLRRHLEAVEHAPLDPDWPHEEPSELDAIEAAQPSQPPASPAPEEYADRVLAAWLGRCAGCMLGKPVELWRREEIRAYLEATGDYPLADYISPPAAEHGDHPPLNPAWPETTRGRMRAVARDDDIDFTMLALHVLETRGRDFTTDDVAEEWLRRFPFTQVYTAERAAYRNLILGLRPPATASHVNPYREWIGAQIRADAFGYVSPGDPVAAARMAFRDAALSHTANGIYGAMWAAALIAAAFTAASMAAALDAALAVVPARSRLVQALAGVRELHAQGLDWEAARDELERRHGALDPVHTINNAAVVAAALLWGEGDFTRTIGLAVQGGWDTDCNGATAGSAFGAMHGSEALGTRWTEPLGDCVRSAVFGFDGTRISELAARTVRVA